jgi:hypothetical protein
MKPLEWCQTSIVLYYQNPSQQDINPEMVTKLDFHAMMSWLLIQWFAKTLSFTVQTLKRISNSLFKVLARFSVLIRNVVIS